MPPCPGRAGLSKGGVRGEYGLVAAMKVTTSAAMRARDVSRPHAEHLAQAEAAEASAGGSRPGAAAGGQAGADAVPGNEVRRGAAGIARRRSRQRGSGRGRASR
jgi:hypothetical protein